LKRLDSAKEIERLNLDFLPPDLEFLPSGLDFLPKNLDFLPGIWISIKPLKSLN
jgi:hypothetical protein